MCEYIFYYISSKCAVLGVAEVLVVLDCVVLFVDTCA